MIPYDDLVAALSSWRARQGLPVNTVGASPSGPTPVATNTPGSGPRTAPPAAQPARTSPPAPPPVEEALDVDEAAMIEEHAYEPEGDDFAMSFAAGAAGDESESTTIGNAPEPPAPGAPRSPNRNDDW